MDDAMRELGRRAIAAGWRWQLGCADSHGLRVVECHDHAVLVHNATLFDGVETITPDAVPDFSDPATLGCLLAQVRERWGKNTIATSYCGSVNAWVVNYNSAGWGIGKGGDTEAAALVAALEAAPMVAP